MFLEAGLTGMEPAQTGFFQALGIATKITKGNIEVIKRFPLATAGQVLTSGSLARLLDRNISETCGAACQPIGPSVYLLYS